MRLIIGHLLLFVLESIDPSFLRYAKSYDVYFSNFRLPLFSAAAAGRQPCIGGGQMIKLLLHIFHPQKGFCRVQEKVFIDML